MNWTLYLIFVAVGATAELLTMKYPTPGERAAAVAQLLAGGFFAALIIPPSANKDVLIGLFIASAGRVVGSLLSPQFDKLRIYLDERQENAKTAKARRP